VNVSKFTVAASIGWVKVAVTWVAVTTLLLLFVLVGTVVSPLLGLDEITVGCVTAPTRVPGAKLSGVAKALPMPPPASKTANSNAINIVGLHELSNLIIFSSFRFH
jgi:hypothetical protein